MRKHKAIRTEVYSKNGQGQSIADEKICRYLLEMARCKIKNLLQQMKSFSQTECGAGSSLAISHVFGAMRQKAQLLRN